MTSLQCIVGPSRLASELGVRTFYAGTAPGPLKSPIVAPQRANDPPVPSWREIEEQEGRLYGTPSRKVPRNLKHPLTHATYSPTRVFDPELLNRAAVPSEFSMVQWLVSKDGARLRKPLEDDREQYGPFYLNGGKHPFPLNPSFKPPKPNSDEMRQRIFDFYIDELRRSDAALPPQALRRIAARDAADVEEGEDIAEGIEEGEAEEQPVEAISRPAYEQPYLTFKDEVILKRLSEKHHLSIDRLRAIIRLKAFEQRRLAEGKQPQEHFQRAMERVMGVRTSREAIKDKASLNVPQEIDQDTIAASERVSKAVQPIVEMLEADGGEKSLIHLLQPAPSQERQRRELPVETVIPLRRERTVQGQRQDVVLSYCDTTDTPKGRAWERANTGRKSRSVHARKAAYLTRLANLGRLPRELYRGKAAEHMRPPHEAAAQWF